MAAREAGDTAVRMGWVGVERRARTSAEPDLEVEARLPCFAMRRREEARMEEVVLMLKVEWPSPPVPTMSHCEEGGWSV